MCAYHFPRCITDKIIFAHEVCMETCDDVKAYCNLTLGEVVAVDKCTREYCDVRTCLHALVELACVCVFSCM